jgi:4-hydroxy-3-polyprenylbenzoate decarboxylase
MARKIAFAITGASGIVYARRLLQRLLEAEWSISLCVTRPACLVIREELGLVFSPENPDWQAFLGRSPGELITMHGEDELGAPPATGSASFDAYVICPCTVGTLGRIAGGYSESLITRMADVALKERRKLILVPRETPYSAVHLRNMLALTEAGAVVLPASPGFYQDPKSIDDLVEFIVNRILSHISPSL